MESELVREHADLAAMVGFVGKHVAEHFNPNGPGGSEAVPGELFHAAATGVESFREHLEAAGGALGQSRTRLLRRAVRTVELRWNVEMRRGQPYPLAANVVHVGEDRGDSADVAGRFGFPCGGVEVFD